LQTLEGYKTGTVYADEVQLLMPLDSSRIYVALIFLSHRVTMRSCVSIYIDGSLDAVLAINT